MIAVQLSMRCLGLLSRSSPLQIGHHRESCASAGGVSSAAARAAKTSKGARMAVPLSYPDGSAYRAAVPLEHNNNRVGHRPSNCLNAQRLLIREPLQGRFNERRIASERDATATLPVEGTREGSTIELPWPDNSTGAA